MEAQVTAVQAAVVVAEQEGVTAAVQVIAAVQNTIIMASIVYKIK